MNDGRPVIAEQVWATTTGVPAAVHVVLVHGSLDRSAGMVKLSRRLEDRFRVTRYDRRGYGRSMPHAGPFGMEQQVADLVHVIESAPEARSSCVLFGHSYGGNVALAAAERHPVLVRVGAGLPRIPLKHTIRIYRNRMPRSPSVDTAA